MKHSEKTQYILKVGEIMLKGGNRSYFERLLRKNLRRKLSPFNCSVSGNRGRFFLESEDAPDATIKMALSETFGIVGFARVHAADKDMQQITALAVELAGNRMEEEEQKQADDSVKLSFKIVARRSDKSFSLNSYQIACELGATIESKLSGFYVDVKKPDWRLHVEIREKAYLFGMTHTGPGGLPVGSAGRGLLMLSGGIDSPVAGYLMAKRGLALSAVYFHTFPYTSDQVKEKVIRLARILARYSGPIDLAVVPFTKTQLAINRQARSDEVTLLMRSSMVSIAHILSERHNCVCLVTGEALSQVASQTAESIRLTNSFTDFPIMRPLIGLDKQEIISRARKIDTYETSILPYDDCCTVFSPKHPAIRPKFQDVRDRFIALRIDSILEEAVDETEIVRCEPLPESGE